MRKPMPAWGPDLSGLNLDDLVLYRPPNSGKFDSWDDVPDEQKETFEKLGIPQAEREYLAGVVGATQDLGQCLVRPPCEAAELAGPPSRRRVQQQRPHRVDLVRRKPPRDPKAQVILRNQEVPGPRDDVGLVAGEPPELRQRPCRRGTLVAGGEQQFAVPVVEFRRLGAAPLVVPEDRGAQRAKTGVEDNWRVCAGGEGDAEHPGARARRGNHETHRLDESVVPVVGILLRPARRRRGAR